MFQPSRASRFILLTWGCYAILWLAAITSTRWAPAHAGLLIVTGFGLALVVALIATVWATTSGLMELRASSDRSGWNGALVALSTIGLLGQLAYVWFYWHG